MTAFFLAIECENCEEDVFYGPCLATETRPSPAGDLAVIPLMMTEQVTFECRNCGARNHTGDADIYCEGGQNMDDEDGGDK